jgi:hypothetical protein
MVDYIGDCMNNKNFEHRILAAEAEVGDLTSSSTLFISEDFCSIHADPLRYIDDALEFMSNVLHTEQQKEIAALSMQRLPLPNFVQFATNLLTLRERDLISSVLFRRAVFPTYDWNTKLAESYDNEPVAAALSTIVASNAVDIGTKVYIQEQILSGKARSYILDLKEAGQLR